LTCNFVTKNRCFFFRSVPDSSKKRLSITNLFVVRPIQLHINDNVGHARRLLPALPLLLRHIYRALIRRVHLLPLIRLARHIRRRRVPPSLVPFVRIKVTLLINHCNKNKSANYFQNFNSACRFLMITYYCFYVLFICYNS